MVQLGFANSNSAARRLIESGSVKIDGIKIKAVNQALDLGFFKDSDTLKLSVGKKKFAALKTIDA